MAFPDNMLDFQIIIGHETAADGNVFHLLVKHRDGRRRVFDKKLKDAPLALNRLPHPVLFGFISENQHHTRCLAGIIPDRRSGIGNLVFFAVF